MKILAQYLLCIGLAFVAPIADSKPRDDLSKVFVPDMLTADIAYLEHMVGPAKRTEGNDKEFVINGCKVTVTSANGSIRSLALELNPKCTVDLNKFLQNTTVIFPSANRMTFGQFEAAQDGTGQFMSDCLDCGTSMDPIVSEFWIGSHADNVLEVELSVTLVASNAIDASFVWQDAMAKGEGAKWWQFVKFNCKRTKYDLVAHRAFKDVKIDAIRIGYGLEKPRCGS